MFHWIISLHLTKWSIYNSLSFFFFFRITDRNEGKGSRYLHAHDMMIVSHVSAVHIKSLHCTVQLSRWTSHCAGMKVSRMFPALNRVENSSSQDGCKSQKVDPTLYRDLCRSILFETTKQKDLAKKPRFAATIIVVRGGGGFTSMGAWQVRGGGVTSVGWGGGWQVRGWHQWGGCYIHGKAEITITYEVVLSFHNTQAFFL